MIAERLIYGFSAEPVADPVALIEGEGLLSWIARTTLHYDFPHITTIMREVGQANRNKVVDVMRGDIEVDDLAIILGGEPQVVHALRGESTPDGYVRYLGSRIRAGDLHTSARRFAPGALRRDEIPYYRASWLIRTFPVCTESWQILRSACECGTEPNWATVTSLIHCAGCGTDLRELDVETVPDADRPGLSMLANILFGDDDARTVAMAELPPDLRSMDPGDVFELALLMARIVDPTMGNPRELVWREAPTRLASALAKAAPLLKKWPLSPWLALAEAGDVRRMLPRCAALTNLHRVLTLDFLPNLASPIAEDISELLASITLREDSTSARVVDLNEAVRILPSTKRTMRTARAEGHLEPLFVLRRGEILPGYDLGELERYAATNAWPSSAVSGKRMGIPPYGVEQLCAMDELVWAKAPRRTLKPGLRIDPVSEERFMVALRASAGELDQLPTPVSLNLVMRGIGGREKPWGPVLRALMEGRFRFAISQAGNSAREIMIDIQDANTVRQMQFSREDWTDFPFSNVIWQVDACDILNVPLRYRSSIERYRIGGNLKRWIYSRADVEAKAARIVTSSELGAFWFLQTKSTQAIIRNLNLTPLEFGFDRSLAPSQFAACQLRSEARDAGLVEA